MVLLEGPLSKWTNVMKGWQFRWFVLEENSGLLSYYTSKEKMMKGVRRGCVRLKGAVIGIDDQDYNTFTITVDHKTFHFQAKDGEEREKWVRRLENTILRHANRNRGIWTSDHGSNSPYGGYNPVDSVKRSNYLQTLDKRICEADAYLQLMIEQANKIENKLGSGATGGNGGSDDGASVTNVTTNKETGKNANEILLENTNAMLESFKHSIVLLQIAKNTAHPINGIYHGPAASDGNMGHKNASDSMDRSSDSVDAADIVIGSSSLPTSHGVDGLEKKITTAKLAQLHVPETSYSSSEGEDDFYDANEAPFSSSKEQGKQRIEFIFLVFPVESNLSN